MKALRKIYHYIRCVPKTLLFNFYYFPFKQAIKFPVIVNHRTKFLSLSGQVIIPDNAKTGKIRLGFGNVQIADSKYSRFTWNVGKLGVVILGHNVKIGTGCRLYINGRLAIGNRVNFTGESSVICYKNISIGEGSLISWRTIIMDTDFHVIENNVGECLNPNKNIFIGKYVWISSNATILKGVTIGNNSIISASSHVVSSFENNVVIGGNPAKVIGSMENKKFIS